jgi:putative redox protein
LRKIGGCRTLSNVVNMAGEYVGELQCTAVHGPSGRNLTTDAPKDNQGRGESFSPTDLVATALATCIVTTLAIAARKQGVELGPLRYEVTKEMTAQPPRRIGQLGVDIWLPPEARRLPEGFIRRTAENCPVHLSLAPEVKKVIEFHWL